MVGDDDIHPIFICKLDRTDISDTVMDSDEELRAIFGDFFYCFIIQTKALIVAMWYIIVKIMIADSLEKIMEHRSGRNAVHIVIAVNNGAFAFFYGRNYPLCSFFSIFQEEWIM